MDSKKLKIIMVQKEMSQKELSKQTGLSETSISLIANGKVKAKLETVIKIAPALEVSVEELI